MQGACLETKCLKAIGLTTSYGNNIGGSGGLDSLPSLACFVEQLPSYHLLKITILQVHVVTHLVTPTSPQLWAFWLQKVEVRGARGI